MSDSTSWKKLADEKEKEWRQVLESRINALEGEVKQKDTELASEKIKFNELKEHFKYNLKLLEERDRELEKYDISFSEIRNALNQKNAEISELKIYLDDLKNVIKREEKTKDELQANYQRRIREKQMEVDTYKSCKDKELLDERKEYEQFRRDLQRQLVNVQNELDIQKRELTSEFDDAIKKREHEFKLRCDELSTKALEYELKVKVLEKELELSRDCYDKTHTVMAEAEDTQRQLEKLLKQREWELTDTTAMKDAEIADLRMRVSSSESSMKKLKDDFQRKFTDMDQLVRDKENTVERVKNGYHEKEEALLTTIRDLQSQLEDAQIRERQLQWSKQDLIKENEIQIENLKEEIKTVKERWDRHVAEISKEHVSRDLELGTAIEEQRRLKLELEQRKEDLEMYKNELKAAAEREEKLDKAKMQSELDWQRRCEDLERQQYDKSEDLIKKLTTARNDSEALLKERERELRHKVLLIKSLHKERDQLRALLKRSDIPLDNFIKYSLDTVEKGEDELDYIEELQRENTSLKQLIAMMRQEMEALGGEVPKLETGKMRDTVNNYEEELKEVRQENKELRLKLKETRKNTISLHMANSVSKEVMSQLEGNNGVKNHILGLNATIGNLRSEKVELAATVKKQQARMAFLENSLEDISKQPRQKQIQIDQLTYELSSCRRRYEGEINGLKTRVGDLELQLTEARREADEYHRASLERNEELVALGNQLSSMKMELSETNPSINFGAQELYIQQLQTELSQLRKRAEAVEDPNLDYLGTRLDKSNVGDLKNKLKSAASKIIQLAKENQQLTESNNRLRTELKASIAEKSSQHKPAGSQSVQFSEHKSLIFDNNERSKEASKLDSQSDRLAELEKLQYQLTKQELQYAQRFKADKPINVQQSFDNKEIPERDMSGMYYDRHAQPYFDSLQPIKAKSTPPRGNRTPREADSQMLMSMSSGGGESIQKVWEMLEDSITSYGSSLMPAARPTSTLNPGDQGKKREFVVKGERAPTELKSALKQTTGKSFSSKVTGKNVPRLKQKVRNYNVKDDPDER
ncbi:unnamed protein product [Lymnaea stagnalis]|uniref:Uncharacterized protein n=1 Tax=Lymnaea stagnalis TaxID=6523 RepID=A0AAV2H1H8_LYMST